MKRETRVNLIFLSILLVLTLPGIVILTRRGYQSGGRDPAMRPMVRTEFAYMDPSPPQGLPRVVPPGVGRFIQRTASRLQTMQPGLRSIVDSPAAQPVMSDALNLQLLGYGPNGGKFRVALFGWNSRYAPLPELYEFTGTRGGETIRGEMREYEPQNLPIEIRSELQEYGYVVPPDSVLWFVVTFPGEAPVETVRVSYKLEKTQLLDTISLAPALATTTPSAR